ncbi:MAG TPA: 2-oxoglutarate dehydrogenase, E2 component, dihydrolipoamide succinyltransferase [Terriglobia bacterium]|nr:2-oxoglutarate dehydrogenase, E2 component, dihydrolipoamide succinyltransferase [Terriglobia bacterium]
MSHRRPFLQYPGDGDIAATTFAAAIIFNPQARGFSMPVNITMPQMGESVAEGTITRWIKKVGDTVERDEPLFEISTDKVDAEIPSPAAGKLTRILVNENETVEVNTVVAEIESSGAEVESKAETAGPASSPQVPSPDAHPEASQTPASAEASSAAHPAESKTRSSPLVRKMAHEHHIDLAQVRGTGEGGRISKKDVLDYLAAQKEKAPVSPAPAAGYSAPAVQASHAPASAVTFSGPTQTIPMTVMRRQIAERMVMSKRTSPHVATVFEAEMSQVAGVMARHSQEFENRNGIKLTYTPFFVRAVVEGLKQYPIVNSSLEENNIVYRRDINIGIAVALETGLIVPVIKRADEMSFLGVARAVRDLAGRARSKRLSVEEVQDGTFTISNHGVFGSLIGTPIIHQPQVAILGVGAIEKRPVVRQDAIAIRTMTYLTLSFDHRVLDGAAADRFMAAVKAKLEGWDESVL